MEKITLYIADKKVDLDEQSFILFNYAFDDLSNPTIVKNSFTKQITLKATATNNAIFGKLFRSDRTTTFGEGYTGMAFDPLRKTPFTIYNSLGEVVESGYVKVDSVTREGYKISLYGGLGSFLYGLTYDEEGNKRTLYGMRWKQSIPLFELDATTLLNAWNALKNGSSDSHWSIINFAPCYNGLPADFDANKVLFNNSEYYPFSSANMQKTDGGVTYTAKSGYTSVLATLESSHIEWEMRSIITFLQRPVIRLSAIIDAIATEAREQNISFKLDETFFNESNPLYHDAWVTLPMIPKEQRFSSGVRDAILKSSLTPCDYLLMLVKMCGLSLTYGKDAIQIQTRNSFFSGSTIDLTDRIDATSIEVTPLLSDSKWYRLGGDKVVGEQATTYKETYNKEYGAQYINTGYDFNSEVSPLTKDIPFIGGADVTEVDYTNAFYTLSTAEGAKLSPIIIREEVKVQLYANGSGDAKDFTIPKSLPSYRSYWSDTPYADWLPKVQFHSAENKAENGEHCMLLFNGVKTSPVLSDGEVAKTPTYYVTGWLREFEYLNEGVPCWVLHSNDSRLTQELPSFRRFAGAYSAEWGMPMETYTNESMDGVLSLYDRYWKAYLSDRYDVDTRKMVCKVNLSGMQVGQALLGRFFYYDNAVWVLNKVSNHSVTTADLTECEFIKVKDIKNYTQGQNL